MRYIDHIRNMSDEQLAYFLNAIQPEITLWSLSMMRALSRKPYKGVDALNAINDMLEEKGFNLEVGGYEDNDGVFFDVMLMKR